MKLSKFSAESVVFGVSLIMIATATAAAAVQGTAEAPQQEVNAAAIASDRLDRMTFEVKNVSLTKKDERPAAAAVTVSRGQNKLAMYAGSREPLAPRELKELLRLVGFEGQALKSAWAIVMKESGGRPKAHNGNANTGDNSYGLFQINMIGNLGVDRREKFDLEQNEELFNPVRNAEIAFHMSGGGKDFGAWGIGPNAYNGGKAGRYHEWLAKYPEE